jgi:hypothetical protein
MANSLTIDQIAELARRSGRDVLAEISVAKDPAVVDGWINGDIVPNPRDMERLQLLHNWSIKIPNDQTFRLWLKGPIIKLKNRPGLVTPVAAIRIDAFDAVNERVRNILPPISGIYGL